MTPDETFAALNLELPPAPTPLGVYKPFLIDATTVMFLAMGLY